MATNDRKVSLNKTTANKDRAEVVSERPTRRTKFNGHRDILNVEGRDPNYEYRYVKDVVAEVIDDYNKVTIKPGQRLMQMQDAGWQYVSKDEVRVGEISVYETENLGSIVRIPAGMGEWLYLMKQKKEWYDEDQQTKKEYRLDAERQQQALQEEEGMYGSVQIDYNK